MAVLNIVLYPDDPLKLMAAPYDCVEADVEQLAKDMIETMIAYEGVGLAGPQVGLRKRIFVMREWECEPRCLINPEILESEGSETKEEGCLSLPYIYAEIPRATHIRVRALNEVGETLEFEEEGFSARIIQHEIDHLNGVIFLERVDLLTREDKLREWEEVRERLVAGVQEI